MLLSSSCDESKGCLTSLITNSTLCHSIQFRENLLSCQTLQTFPECPICVSLIIPLFPIPISWVSPNSFRSISWESIICFLQVNLLDSTYFENFLLCSTCLLGCWQSSKCLRLSSYSQSVLSVACHLHLIYYPVLWVQLHPLLSLSILVRLIGYIMLTLFESVFLRLSYGYCISCSHVCLFFHIISCPFFSVFSPIFFLMSLLFIIIVFRSLLQILLSMY